MSIPKETLDQINDLLSKDVAFVERRKITELTVGKVYKIQKMISMVTRFGKTILVTLYDKTHNVTFEIFLPKRAAENLSDDIVDIMNTSGGKYTLCYLGQSSHVFSGNNTRTLLKFDCFE